MAEYIEREATYEDFEKCNSVDPKWTPGRVKALIARQKPPTLPRCGMGGGREQKISNQNARLAVSITCTLGRTI